MDLPYLSSGHRKGDQSGSAFRVLEDETSDVIFMSRLPRGDSGDEGVYVVSVSHTESHT